MLTSDLLHYFEVTLKNTILFYLPYFYTHAKNETDFFNGS